MDIEARLREKEMALQKKQEEFTLAAKEIKERNKLLLPPDGVDVQSRAAKQQSLCRARSGLPRQVPNFAGTVLDVVSKASPMNAEALKKAGIIITRISLTYVPKQNNKKCICSSSSSSSSTTGL